MPTEFHRLYKIVLKPRSLGNEFMTYISKVISFRVNEIIICICFQRPENVSSMKMRIEMEMDICFV